MTATFNAEDEIISTALRILDARFRARDVFTTSGAVKQFLRLQAQGLDHEAFGVMFLDAQNRLIGYERLFRGTAMKTAVHPREIVRRALAHNAAAVILHHNHPSGFCSPSIDDEALTHDLLRVLALVDVRIVDHVVTSDDDAVSMRECGLL